MTDTKKLELVGLALMRKKFDDNQISKLPKPTKKQTEEVRADFKKGGRCKICGGWHHPDVIHLDYVGHAALTDRLLDCDINWSWEPASLNDAGLPVFDQAGGMWIKLTVCGVTRLGYGHSDGKTGGDAVKEVIGDALRNAAMRFGAALDLWHKGELHADDGAPSKPEPTKRANPLQETAAKIKGQLEQANDADVVKFIWDGFSKELADIKTASPDKAYAALISVRDNKLASFEKDQDQIPDFPGDK